MTERKQPHGKLRAIFPKILPIRPVDMRSSFIFEKQKKECHEHTGTVKKIHHRSG